VPWVTRGAGCGDYLARMDRSHPWLGGSASATFVCPRPLPEAVRLLAGATPLPGSAAALDDGIVGTVTAEEVKLWREVRLSGQQVRARFRGRLEVSASGTRLIGEFTPCSASRLWHGAWFATLAAVAAYAAWAVASALAAGGYRAEAPYVGVAIFAVATLANAGANWVIADHTRAVLAEDIRELSEHLGEALGARGVVTAAALADAPPAHGTIPA
jgi:hypothetical protein